PFQEDRDSGRHRGLRLSRVRRARAGHAARRRGGLGRSARLHLPALLRFLRLFGHGHRAVAPVRRVAAAQFQLALQVRFNHRFLARLAHDAVALPPRLSVRAVGRQPPGCHAALSQPHDYHAPWRPVARRKLDFRGLGWAARAVSARESCVAGTARAPGMEACGGSRGPNRRGTRHFSRDGRRVGLLPLRHDRAGLVDTAGDGGVQRVDSALPLAREAGRGWRLAGAARSALRERARVRRGDTGELDHRVRAHRVPRPQYPGNPAGVPSGAGRAVRRGRLVALASRAGMAGASDTGGGPRRPLAHLPDRIPVLPVLMSARAYTTGLLLGLALLLAVGAAINRLVDPFWYFGAPELN